MKTRLEKKKSEVRGGVNEDRDEDITGYKKTSPERYLCFVVIEYMQSTWNNMKRAENIK